MVKTKTGCWLKLPLITAVLLLSACSGNDDSAEIAGSLMVGGANGNELAEAQVLRRGNGAEPQSLDPHRAEGVPCLLYTSDAADDTP